MTGFPGRLNGPPTGPPTGPLTGRGGAVPQQSFQPSSGTLLGWVALIAAVVVALTAMVVEPNLLGVRVLFGAGFVAALTWVALLRPRAAAYGDTLVLRNLVSDLHLPLARIDTVRVRQMLQVWIEDDCYRCVGIGRSTRSMVGRRPRGALSALGLTQADDRMGTGQAGHSGAGTDYSTFVENRIEELARTARRDLRSDPPRVRRVWAVAEITALVLLGSGFLVTLML